MAFDPRGKTFRHETYPEYKGTRQKAPEEMTSQFDELRAVAAAHGVPVYEVPGFEADDVIGTLALAGERAGYEVFIVTGDKDFMQVVSDRVKLYNVFKPNVDLVIEDVAAVAEKFGTTPDHVIDVLAIMGDASDNVPGVKGIGEKGAAKLVSEFGSVSGLLERLDEVKGKAREHIERDREQLLMSLDLVTIRTDMDLDPPVSDMPAPAPDSEALIALFKRLDFQRLLKEAMSEGAPTVEVERDYVLVNDEAMLKAMIEELRKAGAFSVDTETTGLHPLDEQLVGVSFSAQEGRAFYVPFNQSPAVHPDGPEALLEALKPLLTDPDLTRVGQNGKYDALVFAGQGLDVPPMDFDTMIASFCVAGASRRHGLDLLALHYLNIQKIPTSEIIGTGKNRVTMAEVMVEQVADYACEDADVTWRLKAILEEELEQSGAKSLFYDLEMPLVPVLTNMERRGIRLDTSVLDELGKELEIDIEVATNAIHELAGETFNVNSTRALGAILFEKLCIQEAAGVKRPKRTKTGWATDHQTLSQKYGEVPIVQRLLEYRAAQKLKSTYVDPLPGHINQRTGRVHCSFSQVSAATGRLSSSDPNLQNIPVRTARGRRMREAFVPKEPDEHGEWVLLAADYSQVELRVMAHLSGDPSMAEAFAAGLDIHASTASKVFQVDADAVDREMRSRAKAINFGLLYGMGPQRLARETGLTLNEAKEFVERYFASFPKVREWIDATLESAREKGYVETLLGRRRPIPDINAADQRTRVFAENAAVNTPVQGSAADVIKRAMIDLEEALEASSLQGRVLLQVHDELLLELPLKELEETRELVRRCMEEAVILDVPLKVDFGHGKNWLEAH
ncbi:MAG: DNA polymerase-1 [Planctomycetota bacterium]